ncbi:hypothetical protein F5Y15DRAFT_417522 [Xylariaceae sp. FL0016]|nr:hypothetical protein F5Y15DRAFT_417522 [Xylariaceae sp. FL0016]
MAKGYSRSAGNTDMGDISELITSVTRAYRSDLATHASHERLVHVLPTYFRAFDHLFFFDMVTHPVRGGRSGGTVPLFELQVHENETQACHPPMRRPRPGTRTRGSGSVLCYHCNVINVFTQIGNSGRTRPVAELLATMAGCMVHAFLDALSDEKTCGERNDDFYTLWHYVLRRLSGWTGCRDMRREERRVVEEW